MPGQDLAPALRRFLTTVAVIVAAWSLSSLGFFQLSPVLDAQVGYNDAPLFFALYYGGWSLAVYLVFRRSFEQAGDLTFSTVRVAVLALMAIAFATFALFVLPHLPPMEWTRSNDPVEFFSATSWYFLPKTVEILFQQILIAALVLSLNELGLRLRKISVLVALLFGGFHLTLAFSYPNPFYVSRYSIAATLFGALVPPILLQLRHGFLITFAIHWVYYAVDIVLIHFAFAGAPGG